MLEIGRKLFVGWSSRKSSRLAKRRPCKIRGESLIHLGEFAEASQALRSYIAQHPTSSEALYLLGYSLNKQNKPAESLKTYTEAAKYAPPKASDFETIGLDYVLLNDYPDAIKWLEHSVELDPNNVGALYALGRCYYTQSRFNDAEKKFRTVLQLEPNHRKSWQNLALVLEALNRPDEADRAFKRSIELSASDSKVNEWPYLDYGGFLLNQDRPSEAVPILQRAVAIAPACAACHEKLGRSFSLLGRSSEAEHELEEAVALEPQNPKMHFELSRVYRKDGNMQKARDEAALSAKLYGTQASPETK